MEDCSPSVRRVFLFQTSTVNSAGNRSYPQGSQRRGGLFLTETPPLNGARRKIPSNWTPAPHLSSPVHSADRTLVAMGNSWQTPDQKAFIEAYLPPYVRHSADGTAKAMFWPDFLKKWFEKWPLTQEGDTQEDRTKKIGVSTPHILLTEHVDLNLRSTQQLKRVFKSAAEDHAAGGRRNLHLEGPPSRKRSEVQVYMSLFYDTRIRAVVQERWAKANIPNMDFSREEVPEDEVEPQDSSLFKDTKIPLCFKNAVAQELFKSEQEDVKAAVRSRRDIESSGRTVHNTIGDERLELVREYQK